MAAMLATKIKLYLEANGKTADEFDKQSIVSGKLRYNIDITNDSKGEGDKLIYWNVDGLSEPTTSQLNALSSNAETEDTNNTVRETRRLAYDSIGNQLDLLYKDLVAGKLDSTGEWAKAIKKVKDDNPKS